VTAVTDVFQRSSLGGQWFGWSWSGAVPAVIDLDLLVGGNTTTSGCTYNGSFGNNQYSLTVINTAPSSGFVGPGVRLSPSGNSGYIGIYFSGSWYIFAEDGTTGPPQLASASGAVLNDGDILTLTAVGSVITLFQNNTQVLQATDTTYTSGAPGVVFFNDTSTISWFSGGDNLASGGLPPGVVSYLASTDGNGTQSYPCTAYANGGSASNITRVLAPSSPSSGYPHAFLIMLPVEAGQATDFGDPIATAVALNAHNDFNLTLAEPGFAIPPWYMDNPTTATIKQETFLVSGIVPWIKSNFATTGQEKIYLIGFSKSGLGGSSLLFRHPATFAAGAFWDLPAGITDAEGDDPDYSGSPVGGGLGTVVGTDANFQANYQLGSTNLAGWASNFTGASRIWLGGYNTFPTDVANYHTRLTSAGILHTYASVSASEHNWAPTPGWVGAALAAMIPASSGSGLLMAAGII
jgi:hypothetical protein